MRHGNNYFPGDPTYSPSLTPDMWQQDQDIVAAHSPTASSGRAMWPAWVRPDPSVGGENGPTSQLGWTTGLMPAGHSRQPFKGGTMVVQPRRPNPRQGHVGFSTRSDRLAQRLDALRNDHTPTAWEAHDVYMYPKDRGDKK